MKIILLDNQQYKEIIQKKIHFKQNICLKHTFSIETSV
jgi:hypothetical protein